MRKFLLGLVVLLLSSVAVQPVFAQGTILDAAQNNDELSLLAEAIEAADPAVAETLGAAGSYTVLAPNNTAIENLASFLEVTVEDLLANPDILTDILLYHVIEGELNEAQIRAVYDGAVLPTLLDGAFINFDIDDDTNDILINDVIEVVATDVNASNGIVHVINDVALNRVINEKIEANGLVTADEFVTEDDEGSDNELDDVLAGNDDFSILLEVIELADSEIMDVLGSEGPYTVFAPTNDAFRNLAATLGIDSVTSLDSDILTQVLLYHVLEGEVDAEAVIEASDTSVETLLQDNAIYVLVGEDGSVTLNRLVTVTETDIEADNGLVHVIDNVLLPAPVVQAIESN